MVDGIAPIDQRLFALLQRRLHVLAESLVGERRALAGDKLAVEPSRAVAGDVIGLSPNPRPRCGPAVCPRVETAPPPNRGEPN